jgi:outer membrane protein assembly factor BamB
MKLPGISDIFRNPQLALADRRHRPRRLRLLRLGPARVVRRFATAPAFVFTVLTALVTVLLIPASYSTAAAQINPSDWPQYLDGPSHSSYNAAATAITVAGIKAGNLQPVWRWSEPPSTNSARNTLQASPTVVDGVVYIGSSDGMFYAFSEATQKILWSDNLGLDTATGTCGPGPQGIISTAAVVTDPATGNLTVYVFGPTGTLYALNAATGATVWTAQVDTPSTTVNDYYSWSSPLVVNGDVYIGISSDCDNPLVPGGLVEYNQSTGARVAIWNSLPPGQIGGSIWSSAAALPDGSIIATTGNGYANSGEPPYDQSMVHLNGSNLNLTDAWSLPPSQTVGDADFGASATLFSANVNGTSTPMVGACNKNGVYYAFPQNNLSGGPLWQSTITVPYPGSYEECDAAAVWNGSSLIEGGGAPTTINGTSYFGSIQALDPATGKPLWQTGIPGFVIGSPTEDGAGVIAASVYQADTDADLGIYLLDASNGQIIGHISLPKTWMFAQPVFAGNDLLVTGNQFVTAYEITTPGPAITNVSPGSIGLGTTRVTLTGSGFSGAPRVFVSGTLVNITAVKVLSPTSLSVTLSVASSALPVPRDITVIKPGTSYPHTADTCQKCLTLTPPDTVSLTSSSDPTTYRTPVTFTAVVSNGTSTVPTGTVSFMVGSTTLGTGTLDSTGSATFTTSTLPAGPNVMDAVYSGDSNNPTSTSGNVDQAVNPVITSTALTSSLNPATYGKSVKLTATVTAKTGGIIPAGAVNFYNGNTFLGSSKLNTSGITTLTTTTLPAGTDHLMAVYSGLGNAAGSPAGPLQGMPSTSNSVTETVNPAATTTTLASSLNPSTAGQSVTITATVANGSKNIPTGTVTFKDGTTTLSTGKVSSSGTATFTTSTLAAGTHQITASYGGDANDKASVSKAVAQVVNS